jgi:hypothetical protein
MDKQEKDVQMQWENESKRKLEQDQKKTWSDWQIEFDRQQIDALIRERLCVSNDNEKNRYVLER